jgi:signal transduction histidine kinase
MADWLWPRSLRARTALAAGLVAAVVFGAAAWEMRHVAYEQQMHEAGTDAKQQAQLILTATTYTSWPEGDQWGKFPFELVDSGGLVSSSSQLEAFETGGRAFMPLPPANDPGLPYAGTAVASFPSTSGPKTSPLVGTRVTAVTATLPLSDIGPAPHGSDVLLIPGATPDATMRAYVFVTTGAADASVAALDKVLYPAVPAGILLVAAVAYFATSRALRPVEQIRARTAAVTATDPRERVAVPSTRDEIAGLATAINATLDRLEEASHTQRRFVADAAHELRSPLASLLATLEVAKVYPDRTDWPETVDVAARQALRLQVLANDLLMLARLDAEPTAADRAVDLAGLAEDVAGDFAVRRDVVSVVDESGGRAWVVGNAVQLERMVRNLVDNAARYARSHVEVRVATDVTGKVVLLTVEDDGPGIPPADRERVFERFTRLEDDRSRDTGGTGLGLAIAREIAERHHGTLHADRARSGGARFVLRVPAA